MRSYCEGQPVIASSETVSYAGHESIIDDVFRFPHLFSSAAQFLAVSAGNGRPAVPSQRLLLLEIKRPLSFSCFSVHYSLHVEIFVSAPTSLYLFI